MRDRREAAIAYARRVLAASQGEPVEKTIWGSPAGKKRIAQRLVAMLPAHKTYVEPFAGSHADRLLPTPGIEQSVKAYNEAADSSNGEKDI